MSEEAETADPVPSYEAFGIVGGVVAGLGVLLVVLAFLALPWLGVEDTVFGSGDVSFADINHNLDFLSSRPRSILDPQSFAELYFSFLAWLLLAVCAVGAVAATMPSPIARIFRVVGALFGLGGLAATLVAIKLYSADHGALALSDASARVRDAVLEFDRYGFYLDHVSLGFWAACAGFVLIAVGSVLGPRRV